MRELARLRGTTSVLVTRKRKIIMVAGRTQLTLLLEEFEFFILYHMLYKIKEEER